jgi:hypothetical protein
VLFDGTKQVLSLPMHAHLATAQQISAWEILVIRRIVTWRSGGATFVVEFVSPPIACLGTDASTLHDALWP